MVSISIIPGGNPEANRLPEDFAAEWTRCDACGRFVCDRCLARQRGRCPCGQPSRLLTPQEKIRVAQAMAQRAAIPPSGTASAPQAYGAPSAMPLAHLVAHLNALGAEVDVALQHNDRGRAHSLGQQAVGVVSAPNANLTQHDVEAIMRWGEQYFRWQLWDAGAAFWRAALEAAARAHPDAAVIERAGALGGAMLVLGGRVGESSPQAVEVLAATRRVFGVDHVLTRSVAAKVMAPAAPPAPPLTSPVPSPASGTLRHMGFFRELRHGDPNGPSLRAAMRSAPGPDDAQIVAYLRRGAILIAAMGRAVDVIEPSNGRAGSGSVCTDGVWAWPDDLPYYIERYRVEAPAEFVAYARSRQWTPPEESQLDLKRLNFGSFAAPATPAPSATPVAEGWVVVLEFTGASKISVIKEIRDVTNYGLVEAKDLSEKLPSRFRLMNPRIAPDQVVQRFAAVGARVRLERG